MKTNISERVQKHRDGLRAAGLRPVQIWVPDTRVPAYVAECRRQSLLALAGDRQDDDLHSLMDQALADVDGWEN